MSEQKDYRWENLNERISALEANGIPGVRDFFATSALGLFNCKDLEFFGSGGIALQSYIIADKMMTERKKNASKE